MLCMDSKIKGFFLNSMVIANKSLVLSVPSGFVEENDALAFENIFASFVV